MKCVITQVTNERQESFFLNELSSFKEKGNLKIFHFCKMMIEERLESLQKKESKDLDQIKRALKRKTILSHDFTFSKTIFTFNFVFWLLRVLVKIKAKNDHISKDSLFQSSTKSVLWNKFFKFNFFCRVDKRINRSQRERTHLKLLLLLKSLPKFSPPLERTVWCYQRKWEKFKVSRTSTNLLLPYEGKSLT